MTNSPQPPQSGTPWQGPPGYYQQAGSPVPKRKRHLGRWIALGVAVLLFAGCMAAFAGGVNEATKSAGQVVLDPTPNTDNSYTDPTEEPTTSVVETTAAPPPKAPAKPKLTAGQENALGSARSYLEMSGFSRLGLIDQLSSEYGDGYSKADATFAADHVGANWGEQAVRSARSYLETGNFSRSGLISQLSSAYGDRYTRAQATYAADKVGL